MQKHIEKYILIVFTLTGCSGQLAGDCPRILEIIKRKEYNLRVERMYRAGRIIDFEGTGLNRNSNYFDGFLHSETPFFIEVKNRCSPGDTLYKERGSLSTIIKKKEINIELTYQCNDTSYSATPIIRVVKKALLP